MLHGVIVTPSISRIYQNKMQFPSFPDCPIPRHDLEKCCAFVDPDKTMGGARCPVCWEALGTGDLHVLTWYCSCVTALELTGWGQDTSAPASFTGNPGRILNPPYFTNGDFLVSRRGGLTAVKRIWSLEPNARGNDSGEAAGLGKRWRQGVTEPNFRMSKPSFLMVSISELLDQVI